MPQVGELVLLISPKGKRYLRRVAEDGDFHSNDGHIAAADLVEARFGQTLRTHMDRPYRLLKPTLYDLVKGVKRQTQIIYPKDIGYICIKLGVGPGRRIIEAGSGSGSLTVAMSYFAGETGRIYTYEARPEFFKLCRRNLDWAGVGANVEQFNKDIAEGFEQTGADALFLDVRTPWDYLEQAAAAVAPGASLGFLVPTVNQVQDLVAALQAGPFAGIEIVEILVRRYKPVPERLRPEDRMVAHTGFLVFCRQQDRDIEDDTAFDEANSVRQGGDPDV
ncbi:MAG: tRNA (adenine-N1)-methyltransferase [Desulfovibrionaceae bacterium]|jgi:tRNA (adenine57-N1/adenine58-N1)-methyltransferase|nr:tRNA (adenine-N1)-methyltransferase [Desulfovibrionaceae bacterium]